MRRRLLPQISASNRARGRGGHPRPERSGKALLCRKPFSIRSGREECSPAVPSDSGPTNRRSLPDMVMLSAALPSTRLLLSAPSAPRHAQPRRVPEAIPCPLLSQGARPPRPPWLGRASVVCTGSPAWQSARACGAAGSVARCPAAPLSAAAGTGGAAHAAQCPDTDLPFLMGTRSLHVSG